MKNDWNGFRNCKCERNFLIIILAALINDRNIACQWQVVIANNDARVIKAYIWYSHTNECTRGYMIVNANMQLRTGVYVSACARLCLGVLVKTVDWYKMTYLLYVNIIPFKFDSPVFVSFLFLSLFNFLLFLSLWIFICFLLCKVSSYIEAIYHSPYSYEFLTKFGLEVLPYNNKYWNFAIGFLIYDRST